jgi:hypothetical protein
VWGCRMLDVAVEEENEEGRNGEVDEHEEGGLSD